MLIVPCVGAPEPPGSVPCSRGALVSETESSPNERGKKTEQKGAVAKLRRREGKTAGSQSARRKECESRETQRKRTAASQELVWFYSHTFHSSS